ncbi:torsin-3A isoform X3 [Equus caballus]|uniref:Torsin-3A n=1 Tax=Equus caballus TaxID=9796 RepID=A0A9L0TLA5_HORSE|nr:torsin-3A isoform X2 [Equus caballus]
MLRCPRSPLRLRLCLCVLLLLLLLLPGAPGHRGDAEPGPGAEKTGSRWAWPAFQGLQERLRAAGALSRRYWALFSCRVWPEHCEEDEEAPAGPLAWGRALLGQQYLDILTTWYCSFQDCCDSGDCRISNNFTGLKSDLSVRLHGQHLAQELVLRTVRGYLELPRPEKALVLSFHGWSGTGKNFVARMLAENLYRDGLRSDCVKVFIAMFHFPHPTSVDLYKEQLTGQIRKTQERCHQTLFIFDEAEKLHPGLLEALRPHLGRQAPENHRAQSPRSIFLFLSNLGGSVINEVVLRLLKAGRPREDVALGDLQPRLRAAVGEAPVTSCWTDGRTHTHYPPHGPAGLQMLPLAISKTVIHQRAITSCKISVGQRTLM